MESQNKKIDFNRISYLCAISLIFSYAEMILPKITPFLKLGLSNIVILSAFSLNFLSFFLLTILKSLTSSIFSGTLFTPFFIISIFQSVLSGFLMFFLWRLNKFFNKKLFSIYGISVLGSVFSGFVQIFLASFYLSTEIFSLLGIVSIFNLISGLITAFFADYFEISENIPSFTEQNLPAKNRFKNLFLIFAVLSFSICVFIFDNLYFLLISTILSFIFQIFSKRKIKILPHISIWIFVLVTSLFSPSGKVFFSLGNFSITSGALLLGIKKSLKLSCVSALSQCLVCLDFSSNKIFSPIFAHFKIILKKYNAQSGNIIKKLKSALNEF